jgi:inosine/xanthosine triphosphatase
MRRMLMVMIGSTRPAKVEAVRDALVAIARVDARFAQTTVEAIDVTAVAPTMPMTEADILSGARIRAQALIDRVRAAGGDDDWLAIGLEGGLDPLRDGTGRHSLKMWVAATDGARWGFGGGAAILLPDSVTRQVLDGRELGDVVDELAGEPVRGTRGAWGVLTCDLFTRQDAFTCAVFAALAPFYNPRLYQG